MSLRWGIQTHDCVASTQSLIKSMAEAGAHEGAVVHAQEQTGGVGRHGREWVSARGNLFISVLLRPSCSLENIGQLSILAGLSVAKTIQHYMSEPDLVTLKWPNDALLEGQKCAGILLETGLSGDVLDWVALGVGINLDSAPDEGACLQAYTDAPPSVEALRDSFLEQFAKDCEGWKNNGMEAIRAQWLAFAHKRGTPVTVKIGSQIESGTFYDIDERGGLMLEVDGQYIKTISAGDVYL